MGDRHVHDVIRQRRTARLVEPSALRACLVAVICFALTLASCSGPPRKSLPLIEVTVAATSLPASASVYVAHEKGFFREEGLDASVHRYGAGRLALEAALQGKADFATVADTPIARAVVNGTSPTIVATVAEIEGANVIVARKDRGISNARDLVGKHIAVLAGTSAEFYLHIYLVASGIEQERVRIVPVEPADAVAAVVEGRVDALSVFAPYNVEAEDGLGDNAVVLDEPGLYTTFWNVAVRPAYARDNRDTIIRFLRAIARANEHIAAKPEEARDITARHIGLAEPALAKQWPKNHWTLELSQPLILTLEDEARWLTGGMTTPDFLENIDTAALRAVSPEAVTVVEPKDQ